MGNAPHPFDPPNPKFGTALTIWQLEQVDDGRTLTDLRPVLTGVSLTSLIVLDLPRLFPGWWHDTCGVARSGKPPLWPKTRGPSSKKAGERPAPKCGLEPANTGNGSTEASRSWTEEKP